MNSRDTLRFITGFLILSLFAGISAYLLAGVQTVPAAQPTNGIMAVGAGSEVDPRTVRSEQPNPAPFLSFLSFSDSGDSATYETNMTDALAESLARSLIDNNPNGPSEDGLIPPDIDVAVQAAFGKQANLTQLPNWKEESAKVAKNIIVDKNPTQESIAAYLTKLDDISKKRFGAASILSSATLTTTEKAVALEANSETAVKELQAVTVPTIFENYHKSLLKVVSYQGKMLSEIGRIQTDPIKVAYMLESQQEEFDSLLEEIDTAAKSVDIKSLSFLPPQSKSFAAVLFGVPTTHAFVFHDPITNASIWVQIGNLLKDTARDIAKWARTMATEILKDQLVHRLVQQVITWVQGGGTPKFIENWRGYLNDVAKNTAGLAIDAVAPQLCTPFEPLIRLRLKVAYAQGAEPLMPRCTLDEVINNIENFYNSFENGGWIAFGVSSIPSNNLFGATVEAENYVKTKIQTETAARNTEANSNNGFLNEESCIGGEYTELSATIGTPELPKMLNEFAELRQSDRYRTGSCRTDNSTNPPKMVCVAEFCTKQKTVTPGGVIGQQLNQALGSPIHRIVNAQDITALVSALINSGLMKLIRAGQRGITGLIKGGAGETVPTGNETDPCAGLTGEEATNCTATTNSSNISGSSGSKAIGTQLSSILDSTVNQLQKGSVADSSWLSMAPGAIDSLIRVSTNCAASNSLPNLANDALVAANAISSMQTVVQKENSLIAEALPKFQALKDKLPTVISQEVGGLSQEFQDLQNEYSAILNVSQEARLTNLQEIAKAADDNLNGATSSCATAIPSVTTQ